ncbi:MAG: serine hydrolase [Planctomycetota bacterium]|nr:serine hydrolase [Planctomycetota bacterium]
MFICVHLWFLPALFASETRPTTLPITGSPIPSLPAFDDLMTSFVQEHKIPAASLAVARNGRLVYARAFGYSNREQNEPAQPSSLFRIASVSKPLTAVAILQLVEQGKLKLTDKAFPLLNLQPPDGQQTNPQLNTITIYHLLTHTAGFDRDKSFDPMFRPIAIARLLGADPPAQPNHIIRYMLPRPLDFPPGQRYAYSNFGYCVLGRIIERISGQSYETYVQNHVLQPLGITTMRIGHTLADQRAPNEVSYYTHNNATAPAILGPNRGQKVPVPYGAWYIEAMDAHGGFLASAPDLVRFASAFNDPATCRILKPQSIALMFARPPGLAGHTPDNKPKDSFYALGWSVRPVASSASTWHNGSLPGTASLLVRRHDGLTFAVLFNTDSTPTGQYLGSLIDPLLHQAADAVTQWPTLELLNP